MFYARAPPGWWSKARSFWRLRGTGCLSMARAPPTGAPTQVPANKTKGARPQETGYKQKGADPRNRPLVKVKTCSSLVSLASFCPGLGLPFVCAGFFFWSRVCLVLLLCPLCFFWLVSGPWGVAFPAPGWGGDGRVSFSFSFSVDGHRPEYRLFQVSLYVCPFWSFRFVLELVLSCLFNGFSSSSSVRSPVTLSNELYLACHKGLRSFLYLIWCCRHWPFAHAPCHRSCLTVRFYATTAILTMINETWVANLAFFRRRWRLPHSCFVDRLGWIAEEDSVAIFVVLLIYNEDEPYVSGYP